MSTTGTQHGSDEAPGVVLSVFRYWRLSILIVAGFAAAAFGASQLLPQRFQAYTEIGLTDPGGGGALLPGGRSYQPDDLDRYTLRQALVLESSSTFAEAREITGRDLSDTELFDAVTTSSDIATVIGVSVEDDDAEGAQALANAVVQGYVRVTRERIGDEVDEALTAIDEPREAVQEDIDAAQRQLEENPGDRLLERQLSNALTTLDTLNGRAADIVAFAANLNDGVDYIEAARKPSAPSEPKPLQNALVAGLVGLVLAGVLSWVRADRHRAADEADDPEPLLQAPMLGTIPVLESEQDLAGLRDPTSVASESFRSVATSLQYLVRSGVLLVTSPGRKDGKTVSAASIAAALVREGGRVVLVDGDARSQGLTNRLLGTSGEAAVGFADLVGGTAALEQVVRDLALDDEVSLPFVPAGGEGRPLDSLLRSRRMADAVGALRDAYDLVVVDCPALLGVADVPMLAAHADGMVLVVSRATPLKSLEAVVQRLELVPAPLVGYVFTRDGDDSPTSSYRSSLQLPWHLVRTTRRRSSGRSRAGAAQNGNGRTPTDITGADEHEPARSGVRR